MAAIDLYSGIGGWSLGFQMAGIPILASYEWWKEANITHNKNFNTQHQEKNIRELNLSELPNPKAVQFVVGSPPCTQFSLANRGGKGDITDGLIDIYKFLEIVEHLQPKYWAMENVPRVAAILEKKLSKGSLRRFKYLFSDIKVYKCSDFGVPQDRNRMIAGNFPFELLESYKERSQKLTIGDVLEALRNDVVVDPIYRISLNKESLTDHIFEPNLNLEEERINREAKAHHPVYNLMSFPDKLDRPSRTITALCTRVSRESIVIRDFDGNLRRLTIRERACLQSFPINYQFFAKTYASKIKMIGNAVPPVLTFYIAQAMQNIPKGKLRLPHEINERLILGNEIANTHKPDNQGSNYYWNRSFWMAITGLRFGSGMRFELKNYCNVENKKTAWGVNFFYGGSKNIKEKTLDYSLYKKAFSIIKHMENLQVIELIKALHNTLERVDQEGLQLNWTNMDRSKAGPIDLIDEIAKYVQLLKQALGENSNNQILLFVSGEFEEGDDETGIKKILNNYLDVFIGILIGSVFNTVLRRQAIGQKKPPISIAQGPLYQTAMP
jgi:DNA (cytosine-5)-methyltransferase 1